MLGGAVIYVIERGVEEQEVPLFKSLNLSGLRRMSIAVGVLCTLGDFRKRGVKMRDRIANLIWADVIQTKVFVCWRID
ncbi:hypothetical protein DVK05_12705 [Halorubrum sp. Atlit-8R]|nr:hypothetical protein DVK08_14450 [Halorubrum sp. Atlit-9R]RLM77148.1 hypothetical protein DVK05_12705 [Halorubrum sp. Atlit-8R]